MICTLKNENLTVEISTLGAQLMSAKAHGCEYIWQGDPEFWTGRAPLLFPICGRLFEGKYTYGGKEYEMGRHGFARKCEFGVVSATDERVVLSLCSDAATYEQFPFDFELVVSYELRGNALLSDVVMRNTGDKTLIATFGAHPAFNVPLDTGSFDEWYIEFSEDCTPARLVFSDTCMNTGKKEIYPIINSRKIPLCHALFNPDAIFLDRIAPAATLKCDSSERSVTMRYADMPYLGLWHTPASEAPFVCIEPWCGLPSFDGSVENLEARSDMFHVLPNRSKKITYEISFD